MRLGKIGSFLTNYVTEEAYDEWLAARGLKRGSRYDHDQCPFNPDIPSSRQPVIVGDFGITCYACAGKGICRGSKKPGFFPRFALVPSDTPSVVKQMVTHFTHWEHAKIVLENVLKMPDSVMERCYRAVLRYAHDPEDPRVEAAFQSGRDMIRQYGRWTSRDGSMTWSSRVGPLVEQFPAVKYITEDGAVKVSRAGVVRLLENGDLSDDGYPAVSVIKGMRIYSHHLSIPNTFTVAAPSRDYRGELARYAPRYLAEGERMTLQEAFAVYEKALPGLNTDYLQLLLVAAGYAEFNQGMTPMVMVTGPTGSAKSATVAVAASTLGVECRSLTFTPEMDRFMQAIQAAADAGPFAVFNEIFKIGNRSRAQLTPRETMDCFLNLTRNETSHIMYKGPVPITSLPALVATEIELQPGVYQDGQIGRRFIYCPQPARLDWAGPLTAAGIGDPGRIRLGGDDYAAAANAIVSHVIDRFFSTPGQTFEQAARMLGYDTLENSKEFDNDTSDLVKFFLEVCKAPPLLDERLYTGPGWKLLKRSEESDLTSSWTRIADDDWNESRRAKSEDWNRLLKVATPKVHFQIGRLDAQNQFVVRFWQGGTMRNPKKTNEEILSREGAQKLLEPAAKPTELVQLRPS